MAAELLLIEVNRGDMRRILTHYKRIQSNLIPKHFAPLSEELLRNEALTAAERKIEESMVTFNGGLLNGFVVERIRVNPTSSTFSFKNVQPYAGDINNANVGTTQWEDSAATLDAWRSRKGIIGGNPDFVEVGNSGGGNRIPGMPYPEGVHFMEAGFKEIFNDLTPKLHAALIESMR